MTPNKERLKLWVDALRSGQYIQGTGVLKDTADVLDVSGEGGTAVKSQIEHCCLGVACEVALQNGFPGKWLGHEPAKFQDESTVYNATRTEVAKLTPALAEWYGIAPNPELRTEGVESEPSSDLLPWEKATVLNDTHGWNFERFATAIERTYLEG